VPTYTEFTTAAEDALVRVDGGGFWGNRVESIGRLAEGVGVVTGSGTTIAVGGAIYK
jgi:hypothetical protein